MKKCSQRRFIWGSLTTGLVLIVGSMVLPRLAWFNMWGLCYPAAVVAGRFWGLAPVLSGEAFVIALPSPAIMTTACSGARFLALTLALLAGLAVQHRWSPMQCARGVLAAYGVTLTANVMRVISVWHVDRMMDLVGHRTLAAGAHAAAGFLVFCMAITLLYLVLDRKDETHDTKTTCPLTPETV